MVVMVCKGWARHGVATGQDMFELTRHSDGGPSWSRLGQSGVPSLGRLSVY